MSISLKDEAIVECPHCGANNRLGAPLCSKCGERVYEGNAPPVVKKRFKGGVKVGVRNGIIAGLVLGFLMVVSLMLWPFPPLVQAKVAPTAAPMRTFIREAERALSSDAVIEEQQLMESSLNAYAQELLGENSNRIFNVYINTEKLVLVSDKRTGPFKISTRLVMTETKEDGVEVDSLWLGHLPLPKGMAKGWVQGLFEKSGFGIPDELWDRLVIRELGREKVRVGDRTVEAP